VLKMLKKRISQSFISANNILVIYKWNNTDAELYAYKILEYLIKLKSINKIYLEEISTINEFIKKYNLSTLTKEDKTKNKEKEEYDESDLEKEYHTILEDYIPKEDCSKLDLVIVIGGDGTTLWASYLTSFCKRPAFLTFNLGTLGYLTYYRCEEYEKVLNELLVADDRVISYEERSTIDVKFITENEELKNTKLNCLNEVTFDKGAGTHLIKTNILINDKIITELKSDGLMIATSTGSTAYSLSSGGPICHYDLDVLILNSICPHSLSFRPIIFNKSVSIKIILDKTTSTSTGQVGNDGINSYKLNSGEGIEVSVSNNYVNLIILDRIISSPLENWRSKLIYQLGWNSGFKNN